MPRPFTGTSQAFATVRGRPPLLWQFRENLIDVVKEALGFCLFCGGATLVFLEVAQGGLSISPRAEQTVALMGRLLFPFRRPDIHEGHVEAHRSGLEAVAGLFKILRPLLVMLAGAIELADLPIENAKLVMLRR